MARHGFWSRVRKSRLVGVLAVYLGASWIALQIINEMGEALAFPTWVAPVALALLVVGLVVVLATAWVQSHPLIDSREASDEVPRSWEVDVGGLRESLRRGALPHLTWGRAALGGAVAFGLLFAGAWLYETFVREDASPGVTVTGASATEPAAPAIAVLPLEVTGAGIEEWREGLARLVAIGMDGAGGMRAIDPGTVLSRWEEIVGADPNPTRDVRLEVGRAAGGRWTLLAEAVEAGPEVLVTADLYTVEGERLGRADVRAARDSMIAVADSLAFGLLSILLREEEGSLPPVRLATITTRSAEALNAFLAGESHFQHGDFQPAIAAYERAVAEDSTFALAYHRLAQSYSWDEIGNPALARYRQLSFRYADRLPERDAAIMGILRLGELGREAATDSVHRIVREYPDDAEAWYQLADGIVHYRLLGSHDEWISALDQAIRLAPRFAPYRIHAVEAAFHQDSATVARAVEEYARLAPGTTHDRRNRLALALVFGDSAARAGAVAALDTTALPVLQRLTAPLHDPRHRGVHETVTAERLSRESPNVRTGGAIQRIDRAFREGRISDAFGAIDEFRSFLPPGFQCLPVFLYVLGFPLPEERLDSEFDVERHLSGPEPMLSCAAIYATYRDHADQREVATARLTELREQAVADGDTIAAGRLSESLEGLEWFDAWRRESWGELFSMWEEDVDEGNDNVPAFVVGEVLSRSGHLPRSVAWLESEANGPWAGLAARRLGQVYEELGRPEEALAAYESVLETWIDADPALDPILEEVRARVSELRSDTDESA